MAEVLPVCINEAPPENDQPVTLTTESDTKKRLDQTEREDPPKLEAERRKFSRLGDKFARSESNSFSDVDQHFQGTAPFQSEANDKRLGIDNQRGDLENCIWDHLDRNDTAAASCEHGDGSVHQFFSDRVTSRIQVGELHHKD